MLALLIELHGNSGSRPKPEIIERAPRIGQANAVRRTPDRAMYQDHLVAANSSTAVLQRSGA
jgi:hypothetical protein